MTSSNVMPTAPDTQKIAIGLLVAQAMSKSNNASQKQLESQKQIAEQFMEQNIATAIQQIIENSPDHATALDEVKKFLGQMNAEDQSWGSDIQSWIKGELNTANSYQPPQDLLNILNGDVQQLQQDQQYLDEDQGHLNACESAKDSLVAKMKDLEDQLHDCAWYDFPKEVALGLEIAGVAVALAAVYVAVGVCQLAVTHDQDAVNADKNKVAQDRQALNNNTALMNTLQELSGGNNLMQNEANENITGYKATVNGIEAFDKAIDGIINELASSNSSKGGI